MSERITASPRADIYENDDRYLLVMQVPGIDPATIDVELKEESLQVKASARDVDQSWQPLRREFDPVNYERAFSVGQRIDRESIQAHYENGVLRIELAKTPEARPRKISVQAA